ncbi:hypothetical protein [Microcoleus sp. FACHB-68]|uniref:hypothetical protein n=1 Tax=Microcoleus sp. FACHB-68 TaxID=2692826 RepID=UPI0018EF7A6E|nr:hypothetical protein [Microcoleus sp. FACHB-68]
MQIEPYDPRHLDAVIRLSLRAWTPVFDSIQKAMNALCVPGILSQSLACEPAKSCPWMCVLRKTRMYGLLSMPALLWALSP